MARFQAGKPWLLGILTQAVDVTANGSAKADFS